MTVKHEDLRYAHDEGHTDVCFSEDGSKFVTCGADGEIRIWSTDEEDPIHNCVGEWALSVGQKGDNVYVSTNNNDIQILSLADGDRAGVLDRFVAPINHIAVDRHSKLLALAGEDMEIKLVNLEKSNKEVTVIEGMSGPCLSVSVTSASKMLAASCGDTKLRIWNIESKVLLKEITCFPKVNSFSNAKLLCRIDFEPKQGKYLAYPEKNSVIILQVSDWSTNVTLTCKEVSSDYSIVQFSPCGGYILATTLEGDFVIWNVSTGEVSCVSKHEKSVAVCGLMWNPIGNGQIVYTDVEGQLGIMTWSIINQNKEISNKSQDVIITNELNFDNIPFEEVDDDDDDDENTFSVNKLKKQYMNDIDEDSKQSVAGSSRVPTPRPRTPEIPLQPPFMPSSTPEHLDPRYMCWNDVGVIRCYGNNSDETSVKSIEVEFHDSSFHNSMMMQNYQDYTMGSLSRSALLVANSSQIHVVPLIASSKEWMLKVEETEEIISVTASENLIGFAMGNYIIRVASVYGTQRAVLSIPGPVISMAAFKDLLMIAHHTSGVRKGDQCINVRLIKFEGQSIQCRDIGGALGPDSTLTWLGFSDIGTPAMMDSSGMLSMYPHNTNTWIPFCDTTKHRKCPGDGFFVTTIFESNQTVGGIKCRGTVYPGFTPRPTMCEIPIEPPFAETTNDKTKMEMNLFTWSMLQIPDIDKKFKETAVKTFALACKNNLDERALELMEIVLNPQIISLALKYASKLDKKRLAEKLTNLLTKITRESENSKETLQDTEKEETTSRKPTNIKLNLKRTPKLKRETFKEVPATPDVTETTLNTEISTPNSFNDTTIDTEQMEREDVNPFLKRLQKPKFDKTINPLSLTDKFAGVTYENETKEVNKKFPEVGEKRKFQNADCDKPKEKQRKLDMFKFKKNS
ncbi:WD repeat and HMG-box DNA-binding protein 1 [Diorhabda carinulata]|uniref:WD repeat and HMG-box DNA-binding protein 1 n=1 Tax=Diorhabda carinulata TaxID=1163345 RepID=UPI0025A168FE|nr:WD repeat and HMG-box DNA-binding protein 1 [Diorhabda carinulata]